MLTVNCWWRRSVSGCCHDGEAGRSPCCGVIVVVVYVWVCVVFFVVVEYDGFTLQSLHPKKIIQVGQWGLCIRFKQTGTANRGVVGVCIYYYR